MPTLLEWQRAMRASLVQRDAAVIVGSLADGAAADRLDIYRNTIFSGLIRTLRLAYPAVERLVGTEFFDGAADIFIRAHLPRAAYLDQYGDTFPDFLRDFAPAASLPYLADVGEARMGSQWRTPCRRRKSAGTGAARGDPGGGSGPRSLPRASFGSAATGGLSRRRHLAGCAQRRRRCARHPRSRLGAGLSAG